MHIISLNLSFPNLFKGEEPRVRVKGNNAFKENSLEYGQQGVEIISTVPITWQLKA